MMSPALLALGFTAPPIPRSRSLLDADWKFTLGTSVPATCSNASAFPTNRSGVQCYGLTAQAQVSSRQTCLEQCCGDAACEVWQWCPATENGCDPAASCWTGKADKCNGPKGPGWVGASRTLPPPPPPMSKCDSPYCQPDFDDSKWRSLDLPHDFVVEGNFTPHGDTSHGFLPYNKGWYRKHFDLPASAADLSVWLEFDGIQRDSVIYLNGKLLGRHLSGYTSFRFPVDAATANFGGANVLAVFVDATQPDGWWYDGGGIYRHVWLSTADPVHVAPWGVYLPALLTSAPDAAGRTADAVVHATTTIVNDDVHVHRFNVRSTIRGPDGAVVGTAMAFGSAAPGANRTVNATIAVSGAKLWSVESPSLYSCYTEVIDPTGRVIDAHNDTFGIRSIAWDAAKGLLLNGVPTKVKGFANHQDFAGVGVAVPDALQTYRVWRIKQMGANAWRTAHNPPTPALLDECDKQGLLVWDENHRNEQTPDMLDDLRSLVLRDRNHPSIVMWSLCNEALCDGFDAATAAVLKPIVKELDPLGQRPVTAAMNGGFDGSFPALLDVMGINYHIQNYDSFHNAHKTQPLIGSETSSDVSDRGVYANDVKKAYVSAYDVNKPGWGNTAEDAWCAIESRAFVAGGFCWTGFDYKGEPTPYAWPNINSHFGVIDIAGFPKDNYHYYRTVFFAADDEPIVHILPHWNWDATPCAGMCAPAAGGGGAKTVSVWAYTNLDVVELFLNGASLGRQAITPCRHLEWDVPYAPGNLTALGFRNGTAAPLATAGVATTGAPAAVRLSLEWPSARPSLAADGVDTALVTAELVDEDGALVRTAAAPLAFTLGGAGRIVGLGNGDPSSHERDKPADGAHGARSAWNGLARVVVQAAAETGTITLTASAPGLTSGKLEIPVV